MSLLRTKSLQIGQDGTATNNFTLYQPGVPDGTLRIGNGNSGSVTEVAKIDNTGFKFKNSIQIGTDSTSTNNFTIYQPATPDGTLRIGVGNADSPTEIMKFDSGGIVTAPIMERRYISSAVTVSHATTTTLDFATEDFSNPSSIYDSGTNKFTPTKAGYYEIYFQAMLNNTNTPFRFMSYIYKNDGSLSRGYISTASGTEIFGVVNTTAIAYFDGSTDTFDCRVLAYDSSSGSLEIISSTNSTYVQYKYLGDF